MQSSAKRRLSSAKQIADGVCVGQGVVYNCRLHLVCYFLVRVLPARCVLHLLCTVGRVTSQLFSKFFLLFCIFPVFLPHYHTYRGLRFFHFLDGYFIPSLKDFLPFFSYGFQHICAVFHFPPSSRMQTLT